MKYVTPISEKDRKNLEELMKSSESGRVRTRAHAILLSSKGLRINEIANIFDADRDAVSSWIDSWEELSFDGLADKPRSGRPPKLDKQESERAVELIQQNPQSVRTALEEIIKETGKTVSVFTIKRIAKKARLSWKRIRRSVRSKRDEKGFEKAKKEIEELDESQRKGEIDLYFFDESGFCLSPSVPYAWQPIGEHIEVPTQKGSCLNVAGFFTKDNHLFPFVVEGSINTDVVIACFDAFAKSIEKKTVVVIDNAPTHTSNKFMEKLKDWEKKGLLIKALPPYCPELNIIEILWRFIKYKWIPSSAYQSFADLTDAVEKILCGVGSKYRITFA
jgi:transposase